jgi:hypothetical protein
MNLVLATLGTLAAASLATLQAKIPATDAAPSVPPVEMAATLDDRKPVAPALQPDTGNPALATAGGYDAKPQGKPVILPQAKPDTYL